MFKKLKQKNTEINELIQKNITYYTLSFTTLIFAFLFLNISIVSIYNLYETNKSLNKNYNLSVYINNNVSQNSIEKIEKNILEIDGIEKVSYTDKQLALQKLTEQLGIASNIVNPLLNYFSITAEGEANLTNAKLIINEIDGVKEVVVDERNVISLTDKINQNKKLIFWLILITFIPIKIIIFNVMHSTVVSQSHDIEAKSYLGLEKKEILKPYYFINNIKFISAGIIGSLIFLNIYELIRKSGFVYLVSTIKVGEIIAIIIAIISLIFPFVSRNLIKVKR